METGPCLANAACSNRASLYFRLDLHRRVVKECDAVLKMDASYARAYLLKGAVMPRAAVAGAQREARRCRWNVGEKEDV